MRYWVIQDLELQGPFDKSYLPKVPGFGSESLVCPDHPDDITARNWRQAGTVPDLANTLHVMRRSPGPMPPDPRPSDMEALRRLSEKLEIVQGHFLRTRDELTAREESIASLKKRLDEKTRTVEHYQARIQEFESRLEDPERLRKEADRIRKTSDLHYRQVADALGKLEKADAEFDALKQGIESFRERVDETLRRRRSAVTEQPPIPSPPMIEAAPPPPVQPEPVLPAAEPQGTSYAPGTAVSGIGPQPPAAVSLPEPPSAPEVPAGEPPPEPEAAAPKAPPPPPEIPIPLPRSAPTEPASWRKRRFRLRISPGEAAFLAVPILVLAAYWFLMDRGEDKHPPEEKPPAARLQAPVLPAPEPTERVHRLRHRTPESRMDRLPRPRKTAPPKKPVKPEAKKAPAKPSPAPKKPAVRRSRRALDFVKHFPFRSTLHGACPNGLQAIHVEDHSVWKEARTLDDALRCAPVNVAASWARQLARAGSEDTARTAAEIRKDVAGWGGLEKTYPIEWRARRRKGGVYRITARWKDLLADRLLQRHAPQLRLLGGKKRPGEAPWTSIVYDADMKKGTLQPVNLRAWMHLDKDSFSEWERSSSSKGGRDARADAGALGIAPAYRISPDGKALPVGETAESMAAKEAARKAAQEEAERRAEAKKRRKEKEEAERRAAAAKKKEGPPPASLPGFEPAGKRSAKPEPASGKKVTIEDVLRASKERQRRSRKKPSSGERGASSSEPAEDYGDVTEMSQDEFEKYLRRSKTE